MKKTILLAFVLSIKANLFAQAPHISYPNNNINIKGNYTITLSPTNTGGGISYGNVTTFAGNNAIDGDAMNACFKNPNGITVDSSGNFYVADTDNNKIRKITPAGVVTTLAGSGFPGNVDGIGTEASFSSPKEVVADAQGNIYVGDQGNGKIRKITPAGIVTTVFSNLITNPSGITIDGSGNLYVNDLTYTYYGYSSPLVKITSGGIATTITTITYPYNTAPGEITLAIDAQGYIYRADTYDNLIKKITPAGVVTTLAGGGSPGTWYGSVDGTGNEARFNGPKGMAVDPLGNVYISDSNNNKIRKITAAGVVTTFAGQYYDQSGSSDGQGFNASFAYPMGLTIDSSGNLYVADKQNSKIRKISPTTLVTTFAGNTAIDGMVSTASFYTKQGGTYREGIAIDAAGNTYVADGGNHKIRKISPSGIVTSFAGYGGAGYAEGTGTSAYFNNPTGIAVDISGNIYVSDIGNNVISKITSAGVVTTLAGSGSAGYIDGNGKSASFNNPLGLAVDVQGNVYVADEGNNRIRKITPAGVVTTFAGGGNGTLDGIGTAATFYSPSDVAIDSQGIIYITECSSRIAKITPEGVVTTLAGGGSGQNGIIDGVGKSARFYRPQGLVVDPSGNVYVADTTNYIIRKITPSGVVTTLTGDIQNYGTDEVDGLGKAAKFKWPTGMALDSQGNLYVSDKYKIKKIDIKSGYTISPALPAGLNIDYITGVISGYTTVLSPPTTYTITATNSYGTDTTTINISAYSNLGVEDIAFKNMVVYPNPTTGEVNINDVQVEKVNVYNNMGQLVKTVTNQEDSNTTTVQLNNLPTGVYYLHIEAENRHTVKQIIKQ